MASLTLDDARRIAAEIGQPMTLAVVDAGGHLVLHSRMDGRMDGAWRGSVDVAINKAFSARAFDISTAAELADRDRRGRTN